MVPVYCLVWIWFQVIWDEILSWPLLAVFAFDGCILIKPHFSLPQVSCNSKPCLVAFK